MRVLFATAPPTMPGGIYATESVFQRACAQGGRVLVTTIPFGRRRPGEPVTLRALTLVRDVVHYCYRICRERPDIVHLNSAYNRTALVRDVCYVLASRLLGQRVFLKYHGSDAALLQTNSRLWRWLTSVVVSRVSLVGVLSKEEAMNFAAAGWPRAAFVIVKNSVECSRFTGAMRPRGAVPELLFIARLVPTKGLSDVIRAMGILIQSGRRLTLTCVGDGPARVEAERLVIALGLTKVVRFIGQVTEAEATGHYLRATILVLPTTHDEGFSMTVFQSLAAGLPIVTTRIRAAADWLEEPTHCLWVRPRDPAHLAKQIGWLLDRPAEIMRMSIAEQTHARSFDAPVVAHEYLELYARILGLRGEPVGSVHPLEARIPGR